MFILLTFLLLLRAVESRQGSPKRYVFVTPFI